MPIFAIQAFEKKQLDKEEEKHTYTAHTFLVMADNLETAIAAVQKRPDYSNNMSIDKETCSQKLSPEAEGILQKFFAIIPKEFFDHHFCRILFWPISEKFNRKKEIIDIRFKNDLAYKTVKTIIPFDSTKALDSRGSILGIGRRYTVNTLLKSDFFGKDKKLESNAPEQILTQFVTSSKEKLLGLQDSESAMLKQYCEEFSSAEEFQAMVKKVNTFVDIITLENKVEAVLEKAKQLDEMMRSLEKLEQSLTHDAIKALSFWPAICEQRLTAIQKTINSAEAKIESNDKSSSAISAVHGSLFTLPRKRTSDNLSTDLQGASKQLSS